MPRDRAKRLLGDLEEALREVGAPVVEFLQPGLTDEQIDRQCEPHGLVLPGELRAWWGWHNGTDLAAARAAIPGGRGATIGRAWGYQASLKEALAYRTQVIAEAQQMRDRAGADGYWSASFLPLTLGSNHTLIAEMGSGDAVVVRRMGFDDAHQLVLAQSLAEYVERWAFALRTGLLAFEPKYGWDLTIPMTADTAKWDMLL